VADFSRVVDQKGVVRGIWLRDPKDANDIYLLSALAARVASEGGAQFPEEYTGAVLTKQYRIVCNTYNDAGGCFVMFGDALAPGEQEPVSRVASDTRSLKKYCVVCEKAWGAHVQSCCTQNSVVAIKREGLLRKRRRYFTLSGQELSQEGLAHLRQSALKQPKLAAPAQSPRTPQNENLASKGATAPWQTEKAHVERVCVEGKWIDVSGQGITVDFSLEKHLAELKVLAERLRRQTSPSPDAPVAPTPDNATGKNTAERCYKDPALCGVPAGANWLVHKLPHRVAAPLPPNLGEGIQTAALSALTRGCEFLLLDLSDTTYIDSCGLGVLERTRRDWEPKGLRVGLVGVGRKIMELLEVTGFTSRLPIFSSPQEPGAGGPA